jgi:hypothetical protein
MTKPRQRPRRRPRLTPPRRSPVPPVVDAARLGGWPPEAVREGGLTLAQDLHAASRTAQARATGGYPPASVMGHFLAPLKRVYQVMDTISAAACAQAPPALAPACTPGCFGCCRL